MSRDNVRLVGGLFLWSVNTHLHISNIYNLHQRKTAKSHKITAAIDYYLYHTVILSFFLQLTDYLLSLAMEMTNAQLR